VPVSHSTALFSSNVVLEHIRYESTGTGTENLALLPCTHNMWILVQNLQFLQLHIFTAFYKPELINRDLSLNLQ